MGSQNDFRTSTVSGELAKLGFEESRNCVLEYRGWNRDRQKLAEAVTDLAASKVDVIVGFLPPEILAARRATATIPIVVVFGFSLQELGLIDSLAWPGGNVTGTLLGSPELTGKLFQIVREVLPAEARIAFLYQPDYEGLEPYMFQSERSARHVGLRPVRLPVRTDDELDAALGRIARERPNALFFVPTGAVGKGAQRVLQAAAAERIPAISSTRWPVEEGALLAFEADLDALQVRAAAIVAKILKGAKPADIPVEQPTRYTLSINMKTANTLGIKIPPSVLVQATRVIE